EPSLASTLYEVLLNNGLGIIARTPGTGGRGGATVELPAEALEPVGFAAEEGILPLPRREFLGYRLLQEYFAFPDKFFFLDLTRFDQVRAACPGDRLELVFLISSFER